MKKLVIVESPTKAKTIRKFLPKGYTVDSSFGHIRDLPASAKEIPALQKKKSWARIGIDTENKFKPLYVVGSDKKKVVKRLKDALKDVDELILATDEDREGEGISWHLIEVLKPKIPYKRMVFHEITKEAIQEALENFREVNMDLVYAQETRRFLDRLAGYTISPLLWKKIAPGLSAGRVQSVAVELLVLREKERIRFKSSNYWDLKASLKKANHPFPATLYAVGSQRIATGKDFDEETGKLKSNVKATVVDDALAKTLKEQLGSATWVILKIETNEQLRKPAPPFITSTLQQESNRKLGLSAKETMRTAQKLYESGFITYMRTDSINLSTQAVAAARSAVESLYGDAYLSPSPRTYSGKVKGAQEAHEAIRPAGSTFRTPQETGLSSTEFKLYDLIWKRTMATQMADARLKFTNVEILAESQSTKDTVPCVFKASGKETLFPGFFRAYVEGSDDPDAALENQESPLPPLSVDQHVQCTDLQALDHETKPPARYTEASLVKALEKEGVGRPSTYASIIDTILNRGYVEREGKALAPTFTAFAVSNLLERHFPQMVDVRFTSEMEAKLDEIAMGQQDWLAYLDSFYNGEQGLKEQVARQESQILPQEAKRINLPLAELDDYQILVGKFGPYVQHGEGEKAQKASLPHDVKPGDLNAEKLQTILKNSKEGNDSLGKHPESEEPVYVLSGRYGPYVQLGDVTDENKKPKRCSLPKGMQVQDVDLDTALKLLSLPKTIGQHPEDGKDVKVGIGRFGPFIVHDGTFKSLPNAETLFSVTLDEAIQLLATKATKKSDVLKDLGEHPENGNAIKVMTGRYGPYIKFGKKNISLGKNAEPDKMTLAEALDLIAKKG